MHLKPPIDIIPCDRAFPTLMAETEPLNESVAIKMFTECSYLDVLRN